MAEFKVGDLVRFKEGFESTYGLSEDNIYCVGQLSGMGSLSLVGKAGWISEKCFELFAQPVNKPRFKSISIETKSEEVHSPKHDVVNNPKHYQLVDGFEVKDLMKLLLNRIENSDVGFTHFQSSCYKEAMQYFLRFMLKNGHEDIQKGVYYMNEVLKEWQEHPE